MSNLKFKNNPCAEHLDVETADDWCPVCLHEENASLKAEVERLKMCQSDKATKSILYTDTIGGEQVCRDDMWAISTTTLNALTASEQRVKELEAEAQEEQDEFRRVVEDDRAKDEVHCGCCVELRLRVKKLEGLLEHSSLYLHDYLNAYSVNPPVQEMIERIDKELKGE